MKVTDRRSNRWCAGRPARLYISDVLRYGVSKRPARALILVTQLQHRLVTVAP